MRRPPIVLLVLLTSAGLTVDAAADVDPLANRHWCGTNLEVAEEAACAERRLRDHEESHLLYANRCEGGCTILPGGNDSRTNHSFLVNAEVTIAPYSFGDASWEAMMECLREEVAPFDLQVTDEDPGTTPHFEAIVAGRPQDIGMQPGVGGVSPFDCGVIENSMVFVFAEALGNAQVICEVVAHESGHSYGLNHEYLCEDVMTYLSGCGHKTYMDVDSQCGEYGPRQCDCRGPTQNSHQHLLSMFGAFVPPTPPEVEITYPHDGARVMPGFSILVTATDNVEVTTLELFIDGAQIAVGVEVPYEFPAPLGLHSATVRIEARATDDRLASSSDFATVHIGGPCTVPGECPPGQTCVEGRCVAFEVEGGLGDECEDDMDCVTGICAQSDEDGSKVCVESCTSGSDECPFGFECRNLAGGAACFRRVGGCTCALAARTRPSPGPGIPAPLAFLFVAGLSLRRRRRRHRHQQQHHQD